MTCAKCRYHSMTERAKVLDVADEEMEIVAFDDTAMDKVYLCRHPEQRDREIGIGDTAGEGCKLFALGGKRTVDPELERRLSWRDERPDRDNCGNE